MEHSKVLVQSIIVGALLIGVAVGGTLAVESLPSGWKASSNLPPSSLQQFNSTALAMEYDNIFSEINANEFSNASLLISSLSFVNYPGNISILAIQAASQAKAIDSSLPLASFYLGNTVDLISLGLLTNATSEVALGCAQALLANSSVYSFQNATTPGLKALKVPTDIYSGNLASVRSKISSYALQCTVLSGELRTAFHSSGTENCVKLGSNSYCLALSSIQKSVLVGSTLVVNGTLMQNNTGTGIGGDTISFYLNGTYITKTTSNADGAYFASLIVPLVYEPNASIWAVASGNSTLNIPIAIGSNAIFIHLLFNGTRIVLLDSTFRQPQESTIVSSSFHSLQMCQVVTRSKSYYKG